MNNYVGKGERIDITAPYAISTKGQGVLVGTALFGIAVDTCANGAAAVIATQGQFDIAKATTAPHAPGDLLYWDNSNYLVTASGSGITTIVAIADATAGTTATTVRAHLVPPRSAA